MNEVKFKANIKDLNSLGITVNELEEVIDQIPAPTVADSGKVLTVTVDSSGETPVAEYELVTPASELPAIGSSDAGKVLTVNDAHTGVEWKAADALPAIASGDAGKVLTVNAGETAAEWAAASGGGSLVWHNASIQVTAAMFTAAAHKKNASTSSVPQVTIEGSSVTVTDVTKCGLGIQYTPTGMITVLSGTSGADTIYKTFCIAPFLKRTSSAIKPAYLVICLSELDDNWTTTDGTEYRSFYWFSEE